MRPILFKIGSLSVPSFFLMVTIGALLASFLSARFAKKKGLQEVVLLDFGIIGMTVGIFGAKIFHVIFENPSYYLENPLRIFYIWQGGLVSVGALISTVIGWFVYLKIRKLEPWPYVDVAAIFAPIVLFFTRIGCFCAGCCFGLPTDSWVGVEFPLNSVAGEYFPHIHIHPTQVYFQINAIILFIFLLMAYKYRKFHGQMTAFFLIYYGITRFFIEFFRSSNERKLYFDYFPAAQMTMIALLIAGILIYLFTRKNLITKSEE